MSAHPPVDPADGADSPEPAGTAGRPADPGQPARPARSGAGMLIAWAVLLVVNLVLLVWRLLDEQDRWGLPTFAAAALVLLCAVQLMVRRRQPPARRAPESPAGRTAPQHTEDEEGDPR